MDISELRRSTDEQITELLKTGRAADKLDRERAEAFSGLVSHPAWPLYQELLNVMIQARSVDLLVPAGGSDGAFILEFVKGSMNGLILARDLPSIMIAQMKPDTSAQE